MDTHLLWSLLWSTCSSISQEDKRHPQSKRSQLAGVSVQLHGKTTRQAIRLAILLFRSHSSFATKEIKELWVWIMVMVTRAGAMKDGAWLIVQYHRFRSSSVLSLTFLAPWWGSIGGSNSVGPTGCRFPYHSYHSSEKNMFEILKSWNDLKNETPRHS